jgi:penicillin-binding protein 1A
LTTIQTGVANSLNTIALRTLRMVTPAASYQFLTEKFGFTTLDPVNDVDESPLAMGGLTYGVTTMEMAAAYATFPRNGVYTEPTTYLKVVDSYGNALLDNTPTTKTVLKTSTAYYINQLLTNAVQNGTGTPAKIAGMTVAGKTGTTNNSYARWFAGYTPYYTGVVWVGYSTNEVISGFSKNPAVVMWQKVMSLVHENLENKSFDKVDTTVSRTVCLDCGKLSTEACTLDSRGSRTKSFEFVSGDEPTSSCVCHVAVELCTGSAVLDDNGNATGQYHLAGEFCPEETRKTVYVVSPESNLVRDWVTDYSEIADYTALKIYYDSLGVCTVHDGTEPDPDEPEPSDEPINSTWPGIDLPSDPPSSEPTTSEPEPTESADIEQPSPTPEESDIPE